jgi:hypothetical protein
MLLRPHLFAAITPSPSGGGIEALLQKIASASGIARNRHYLRVAVSMAVIGIF